MRSSFIQILVVASMPFCGLITTAHSQAVKDREGAVMADKAKMENDARWLYNNLESGFAEAKRSGKPMLVVLRCVPCLGCAGIDARVMDSPELGQLLDEFVCVRVINANSLDLAKFQFDYDLSFSAMILNGDGTVYGRFGSWQHQKDPADKSVAGFRAALDAALILHRAYPGNREGLAGKQAKPTAYATPLDIPLIANRNDKGQKYARELDWRQGKVVKSCVHCHQIGDALRAAHRDKGERIPLPLIFPMPTPETIGLSLAPDQRARVSAVEPGSAAATAGFQIGDNLVSVDGQLIISVADVAWVLHGAPETTSLAVVVNRAGEVLRFSLTLEKGWRMKSDISRRVGTWQMRAMAGGGLKLEDVSDDERRSLRLPEDGLALRVEHLGKFGLHGAANRAGFRKGDILVEVDGVTERLTESQVIGTMLQRHSGKAALDATVLRGGKRVTLKFPMQ